MSSVAGALLTALLGFAYTWWTKHKKDADALAIVQAAIDKNNAVVDKAAAAINPALDNLDKANEALANQNNLETAKEQQNALDKAKQDAANLIHFNKP